MAMMRWDPFGEVLQMQRDMDRIFSRLGSSEGRSASGTWMPRINVKKDGDDLAVHVELAGIKPEDVDIEVTDGVLTIKGERKSQTEREDEGWLVKESSFGSFHRSMVLPEGVDPAAIKADFHDGMLEVHVPKAMEAMKPKTTKVAIGGTQMQMGQGQETTQAPAGEPRQETGSGTSSEYPGAPQQGEPGRRENAA